MKLYGGPTPKRHVAWSNSAVISSLDLGRLKGWSKFLDDKKKSGEEQVKLVEKYIDKKGKQRWKGSKALKSSESSPQLFVVQTARKEKSISALCQFAFIFATICSIHCLFRNYPPRFGEKLASLFHRLIAEKKGMPELPDVLPSAEMVFSEMAFDDVWQDAKLVSVCHWLRGGRGLCIPNSFRQLLPTRLWSS